MMTSVGREWQTLCLLLLLASQGCSREASPELVVWRGTTMGTSWRICFPQLPSQPKALQRRIEEVLLSHEARFSHWDRSSEVSRVNDLARHEAVSLPISQELADVLHLSLDLSRRTEGAYHIGWGQTVALRGFGPSHLASWPSSSTLPPAHECLTLEPGPILKITVAGIALDLSSIAKGEAVDVLAELLNSVGIEDYLIEIGGEVRSLGERTRGDPWTIGVLAPKPGAPQIQQKLDLPSSGMALATTGNYRQHTPLSEGEGFQSHLVHRKQERTFRSVTVMAPTCRQADAWATALFLVSPSEAMALSSAHPEIILIP
ncbi:MAG: FAD:protein FMN transferase [Verrucomicrobiota bacterium]